MSDSIKPGDSVEWRSSGGTSAGRVKKKLTEPLDIKGHHVAASEANPEYLVESDRSGAVAAHKPSALKKRAATGDKKATRTASPAKKAPAKKASAKKSSAKAATQKKPTEKSSAAKR